MAYAAAEYDACAEIKPALFLWRHLAIILMSIINNVVGGVAALISVAGFFSVPTLFEAASALVLLLRECSASVCAMSSLMARI